MTWSSGMQKLRVVWQCTNYWSTIAKVLHYGTKLVTCTISVFSYMAKHCDSRRLFQTQITLFQTLLSYNSVNLYLHVQVQRWRPEHPEWIIAGRFDWCRDPRCPNRVSTIVKSPRHAIKHVIKDTNTDGPLCDTSLVTKTNQPWYLCVACKKIKKGDTIQVHYGPASGILMAQYAQEKLVC